MDFASAASASHNAPHIVAMLLADARLPSGGHAFSAGVEPALQGGLARADIAAFLRARARTTTLIDAATAVVVRHACLTGAPMAPIERAWAARTPALAARTASRELGRGLLRLARSLWPGSAMIALAAPAGRDILPRPLVLGAIAAHTGLDPEILVRVCVYDDIAAGVAALLKLEPGDPVEGVRLVLDACATVEPLTPLLAALTSPDAIPASSAPQAEAWTEAHAHTNRRLYRA